jgi:hypothetical protein
LIDGIEQLNGGHIYLENPIKELSGVVLSSASVAGTDGEVVGDVEEGCLILGEELPFKSFSAALKVASEQADGGNLLGRPDCREG